MWCYGVLPTVVQYFVLGIVAKVYVVLWGVTNSCPIFCIEDCCQRLFIFLILLAYVKTVKTDNIFEAKLEIKRP
jgi:hypothetical protein